MLKQPAKALCAVGMCRLGSCNIQAEGATHIALSLSSVTQLRKLGCVRAAPDMAAPQPVSSAWVRGSAEAVVKHACPVSPRPARPGSLATTFPIWEPRQLLTPLPT